MIERSLRGCNRGNCCSALPVIASGYEANKGGTTYSCEPVSDSREASVRRRWPL